MHLGRLSCLFNAHKPNRKSVKWTGLAYQGMCLSCGSPIRRAQQAKWRAISAAQFDSGNGDN
jgi:hypothetical protein